MTMSDAEARPRTAQAGGDRKISTQQLFAHRNVSLWDRRFRNSNVRVITFVMIIFDLHRQRFGNLSKKARCHLGDTSVT